MMRLNENKQYDHLRWLLVCLAMVMGLYATQLTPWVPLVACLLLLWRFVIAHYRLKLPGMAILLPIALVGAVGILATYGGLFGRDAGVALLTLMTAMKVMETHSRRDMTLVVYLGFFLCVCTFLFTQAIPVAIFMLVPLSTLTALLVGLSHPNGEISPGNKFRVAGTMLLQALPVMLVMFILFPRVPGPLWGIPQDMARGMTGLSEDMSPGSISDLSRSDAVAFRASFRGRVPQGADLYWRGPVFWNYDGRSWSPGGAPVATTNSFLATSTPVEYTVTLEPHNKRWLFVLDLPTRIPPGLGNLAKDYQYLAHRPVRQRLRYDAASSLGYIENSKLDEATRRRALQLPSFGNQRTRAMAQDWLAETKDPKALIQRAQDMFHADFFYTLQPPPLGASAVDGFLFNTRKGFCEHYAASFVFLMRAMGIPARVVTGYQGGEINPMGNYLIVRQSDAHAWAEVWLENQGWVRVDPTVAVAPERVERGIAAALSEAEPLPILARPELTFLKRLNLGWDSINYDWNQWVLGYNQQRQLSFLAALSGSRISWGDMALWLTGVVTLVVGVIAIFMLRTVLPASDPAQRCWMSFKRKLARAGVISVPQEGPRDFAARATCQLPHLKEEITQISQSYLELRYGGNGQLQLLRARVKKFRCGPAPKP